MAKRKTGPTGYAHSTNGDGQENKKTRGFTYVPRTWAIGSSPILVKKRIDFDRLGNPIGEHKSAFVEFVGSLARNGSKCPLNYNDWRKVPEDLKTTMMNLVKEKFVNGSSFEANTKQAIGRSWRCFKSRLKDKYYDPKKSLEQNLRKNPSTIDERVLPEHWIYLVNHWSSTKGKETSRRNIEHRANKKMQHITGKLSFAQIKDMEKIKLTRDHMENIDVDEDMLDEDGMDEEKEEISRAYLFEKCYTESGNTSNPVVAKALEQMKTLHENLEPGEKDEGPNDIFSKVMGEDKGVRVRMFGYSSTSSKVYSESETSQPRSKQMNMVNETEFEEMKKNINVYGQQIQDLLKINKEMAEKINQGHAATSSHSRQTLDNTYSSLQVGATILLKSMLDSTQCVAKGRIVSLDPSKLVANQKLGANWCEVKVNVAIQSEEALIRTMGNVNSIGDSIGRSIAWPKHLIAVHESL